MGRTETDIFIAGAGIAGLAAAISFARAGQHVTIADPSPPVEKANDKGSDLRSTAFLKPARTLLENAGLWASLEPYATPLETLRVIDCAGEPPEAVTTRAFQASDLEEPAFGWNLPNWLTRKVLVEEARKTENLDLKLGAGFTSMLSREAHARIDLSDGGKLTAKLAIGADGRASSLREAAGIDVDTSRYGQKALAFAVTHDIPHENISTESYHKGGAFVLVPLPDHKGKPASAVVWMQDGAEAKRLMALPDGEFSDAATTRSTGILGPLRLITERRLWPVITQTAKSLTAERVALVAEAAHVLPPIGAQGLNSSLKDVSELLRLAEDAPESIGTPAFLQAYARARKRDIDARAHIIDFYNRICRSDAVPIQNLRSLGLKLVHDIPGIRHRVMRAGLGT